MADERGPERYEWSLFHVCERLHMSHTGAGDRLQDDAERTFLKWLEFRLDGWMDPYVDSAYDDAVRALVVATLNEYGRART